MAKFFKVIGKIILFLLILILILAGIVFALRAYNTSKYKPKDYGEGAASIYMEPTNLSLYDKNIDGVTVEEISGDYLNGFHLKPDSKLHKGVIITFGGSEGSPNYEKAVQFSREGYEVLSLFFFGMPNQQAELVKVPLEFFDEVLTYVAENIPYGDVITLYGGSKGAELGLNLAVRYPEINNVIASAPTDYSYMGLSYYSGDLQSSWTWKGEEVPFIDMQKGDIGSAFHMMYAMATKSPLSYRSGYESAYRNDPNKESARIKLEDTNANLLLIAGTDDMMWQSDVAATNIKERRPEKTEALIYTGAGHLFYGDRYYYSDLMVLAMGGDLETNIQAGVDSDKIIFERLNEWHK